MSNNSGGEDPPPNRPSPYSPFPFGSPIGISDGSLLSPSRPGRSTARSTLQTPYDTLSVSASGSIFSQFGDNTSSGGIMKGGRVRAQEAYGGPVMFGGQSAMRRSRLMAASPYAAAALASRKPHQRPLFDDTSASSRRGSSAAATPSPAPSPSPSSTASDSGVMSSTARLILDTLDRMNTPIRDAQKLIPSMSSSTSPPRAEKRRLIAEQLDWTKGKRRRPLLGGGTSGSSARSHSAGGAMNGPPLRTVFSPVPAGSKSAAASRTVMMASATTATSLSSSAVPSAFPVTTSKKPAAATSSPSPFNCQPLHRSPTSSTTTTTTKSLFNQKMPQSNSLVNAKATPPSDQRRSGGAVGGKMRARVGEPTRERPPPNATVTSGAPSDTVTSFLSEHSNALPITNMPTFDFGNPTKMASPYSSPSSAATASASTSKSILNNKPATLPPPPQNPAPLSRSTTDTTVAMSVSSSNSSVKSAGLDMDTNISFTFSSPSMASSVEAAVVDSNLVNGLSFQFRDPEEVDMKDATASASQVNVHVNAVHVQHNHKLLSSSNGKAAPLPSPVMSLVGSKMAASNHVMLPDVTGSSRSSLSKSDVVNSSTAGLKSGSVMDILGGTTKTLALITKK